MTTNAQLHLLLKFLYDLITLRHLDDYQDLNNYVVFIITLLIVKIKTNEKLLKEPTRYAALAIFLVSKKPCTKNITFFYNY